ncbi:2-isopropylmalate synthase [Nevskia soli]|uniref:2-isopropylmalate synthase n=1 Tax=Nevskia soli TaxID=418856 RepID=UPI0004A782C1|nr:2-isopropylmalate synthase [Nevskia soli]
MSKKQLIIFDTTLRDGEQSPGAAMTQDEKLRIALALQRLRVDVIEAGFAAASPGDFAAIQAIARELTDTTVCSLARANAGDVTKAGEALKLARRKRIHTFIATSPIHMEMKLRMAPEQVLESAVGAVKLARQFTDDVEFSAEDAVRSDMDFLCRIFEAAIKAGATTINVPDTVGYSIPGLWGERMRQLIERVPNADKVIWSTHCHNDLGLAVANSLAAVQAGALQVECTINGLGERAGNASLEEIVMAVKTRADVFDVETRIDATQIVPCSRLVSTITGYPVQPNKAIVGANAFAHESGIHQDGVLKHRETYEIMRAEDVGWAANKLTLGKLSGRAAFRARLEELGYKFRSEAELAEAFARFKDLADKKHEIFDEDLQMLVTQADAARSEDRVQLEWMETTSKTGTRPIAKVALNLEGEIHEVQAQGDGPVDAVFAAIEKLIGSGSKLLLYSVNAITTGTDSQGEVTVRLAKDGRVVNGLGADTDIIIASAKAYINAINRLEVPISAHPQRTFEPVP